MQMPSTWVFGVRGLLAVAALCASWGAKAATQKLDPALSELKASIPTLHVVESRSPIILMPKVEIPLSFDENDKGEAYFHQGRQITSEDEHKALEHEPHCHLEVLPRSPLADSDEIPAFSPLPVHWVALNKENPRNLLTIFIHVPGEVEETGNVSSDHLIKCVHVPREMPVLAVKQHMGALFEIHNDDSSDIIGVLNRFFSRHLREEDASRKKKASGQKRSGAADRAR